MKELIVVILIFFIFLGIRYLLNKIFKLKTKDKDITIPITEKEYADFFKIPYKNIQSIDEITDIIAKKPTQKN